MNGQTGCGKRYQQMGFDEMWSFNRQTIVFLQVALAQVIFIAFRKTGEVGLDH